MHCRSPYGPSGETLLAMRITEAEAATLTFYRAVGCERCHQTGYRGRVGIYEVMPITTGLRRLIGQKASGAELRAAARAAGMGSLGEDGVRTVKAGVTTLDELLRVVTDVGEHPAACEQCGGRVEGDFVVCPGCGCHAGGGCAHCGRSLAPDWNYCPYCAAHRGAVLERPVSREFTPRLRAVR